MSRIFKLEAITPPGSVPSRKLPEQTCQTIGRGRVSVQCNHSPLLIGLCRVLKPYSLLCSETIWLLRKENTNKNMLKHLVVGMPRKCHRSRDDWGVESQGHPASPDLLSVNPHMLDRLSAEKQDMSPWLHKHRRSNSKVWQLESKHGNLNQIAIRKNTRCDLPRGGLKYPLGGIYRF